MRLCIPVGLASLFLAYASLAGTARFIDESSILQLDCVRLTNEGDRTLEVELRYDGTDFQLLSASDIEADSACSSTYSSETNLLTTEVRVQDELYQLQLHYEGDELFSVGLVQHLGAGESLLWKVSDGTNEVVIGGTVHILKGSDFPLPTLYTEAFNEADILVTEISNAEFNNTLSVLANMSNPPGEPGLSESLSSQIYDQLSIYFLDIGIPIITYENIRPVWVAQEILRLAQLELGYVDGVDLHFINLALSKGIPSWGLETLLDQVLAVNQTNQHLTADELISETLALVHGEGFNKDIRKLINAWREADTQELTESIIDAAKSESLHDYDLIFTNRNENWVQQIETYLQTAEKEFVLVGAGHLVGPESVLMQLEALGFEIDKYRAAGQD